MEWRNNRKWEIERGLSVEAAELGEDERTDDNEAIMISGGKNRSPCRPQVVIGCDEVNSRKENPNGIDEVYLKREIIGCGNDRMRSFREEPQVDRTTEITEISNDGSLSNRKRSGDGSPKGSKNKKRTE